MSDLIDRQAAISAICNACGKIDCDKMDKCEKLQLPPASSSEFPNNSDTISRQAVIDEIKSVYEWHDTVTMERLIEHLNNLPPAQPEPTDINAKEAVYNLAEKIGIHQLFALTVELRGEPIQPEPHEGHWIKHIDPSDGEQYECSRCGVLWEFNDGTPEDNEAYFCPKCGTKMKGEANE